MNKSKIDCLKKHAVFADFSATELKFISRFISLKDYAEKELILHQGSYGNQLYLIETGEVAVYVTLPGDSQKLNATLVPGQIFGEVSFLTETPITASIVAKENCTCFLCSREILEVLALVHPETAYLFETNIIKQTREKIINQFNQLQSLLTKISSEIQEPYEEKFANSFSHHFNLKKQIESAQYDYNFVRSMPFFSKFNDEEPYELITLMSFRNYPRGTIFNKQDNLKSRLCVPFSGAVMMCLKHNNQPIKSIAVSGVGELFLINPSKIFPKLQNYVSYLTSENSRILELNFEDYFKLKKINPKIFFHLSSEINRYIARLVYIVNRQVVRINCEYEDLLR